MENGEMKDDNNDNFYQPVEVNGQTENLIPSPDDARELAEIEKPGRDIALNREQELKEGLTEAEKENLQIMEALPEKYPHAFTKETDGEGRSYLIFKGYNHDKDFGGGHLVISEKGLIRIENEKYKNELERTNGKLASGFVYDAKYPNIILMGPEPQSLSLYSTIFDLRKTDREDLKVRFSEYEEAHKDDVEPKELTTQDIIDSL